MAKPGTRIEIRQHGGRVGWLRVGKGFIYWKPLNRQTYCKLSWKKFDELMRANG